MPGKKSLTIGITVNLENYENLRLEVTGEVTDQQGVSELVGFLDETLTTFGRGNPATVELIEKYRSRVLSTESITRPAIVSAEQEPAWPAMEIPAPEQQLPGSSGEAAAPAPLAEPKVQAAGTSRVKAVPAQAVASPAAPPDQKKETEKKQELPPEPEERPEPKAATTKAAAKAAAPAQPQTAPAPSPAPGAPPAAAAQPAAPAAACEICGCAVSSSEQKMSQLFMSRTLCKTCMKKA